VLENSWRRNQYARPGTRSTQSFNYFFSRSIRHPRDAWARPGRGRRFAAPVPGAPARFNPLIQTPATIQANDSNARVISRFKQAFETNARLKREIRVLRARANDRRQTRRDRPGLTPLPSLTGARRSSGENRPPPVPGPGPHSPPVASVR
jgi:hypothetical protein